MKRNKKITVFALSALLVMTLAVTVISFSFAGNNNNNNNAGIQLTAANTTGTTLTNIDYIIKGTADIDADPYKVVEIGSSPVAVQAGDDEPYTTFGEFAEKNGGFRTYVINGNRTITEEMADKKINYVYYYSADVTDDNEAALADISSADFIYVSNDSSKPYSTATGNDINEELYNILHIFAVGDYKPFIIDSPADSGSGGADEVTASTKFDDLVAAYYEKSGYLYNTFQWKSTVASAADFYGGQGDSLFIQISGRARMSYWTTVKTDPTSPDTYEMAEILVVSDSGTEGTFFTKAMAANSTGTGAAATSVTELYDANDTTAAIQLGTNESLYKIDGTEFYASGYSARYATYKPEYARVTNIKFDDLKNEADFDYTKYDLVIFEDDLHEKELTDAGFYKRLVGAMYGKTHIIFSDVYTSSSTGSGSSGKIETSNDSNYKELYFMVATEDGIERFSNIMVTTKAEMDIIISSNNAGTCKTIADLINSASFRGIGGPSSTSNMYTVLEIQPCYPIDEALAQLLGNSLLASKTGVSGDYYTSPADMVNGKTREQLGIKSDADLTRDTPQYYAWELSEAKVAELTGLDVSQVKVVHMSTEELATSKTDILGNYDLVYIGGNMSALLDATQYYSVSAYQNAFYSSNGNNLAALNAAPIYAMYSHNGDIVNVNLGPAGEGGLIRGGKAYASADYKFAVTDYSGSVSSFATYNGNDITRSDLSALCEYVDAGMPLVINKDLYNAYKTMTNLSNRYLQNSIDPDSNVCQFLDYCQSLTDNGAGNILWNFDHTVTIQVDNDGGRLGDTATGTVEVYTGENTPSVIDREDLDTLIKTSTQKPKVAVTSMPASYNMYDKSTRLKSTSLKFEYDVANAPADYDVNLYIDYNKDGTFTDDEIVATGGADSLSCDVASLDNFGSDYFGPVYWQLEVVAKYGTKTSTALTSGICYIDGQGSKQEINVLQIIPADTSSGESTGMQGSTTLLFCTECQRALKVLEYNPVSDSELSEYLNVYDGHITSEPGQYIDANGYASIYQTGTAGGNTSNATSIYMGRHEHNFGIVKYDSTKTMNGVSVVGMDDWDYNFADELSDLYDFNIDILTSREYEDMNKQVQNDVLDMISKLVSEGKITHSTLATLTDEEKEVLKQSFMEEAAVYDEAYNTAVEELEKANQAMQDMLEDMIANSGKRTGDDDKRDYKSLFTSIKETERYGDFYMIWGTSWNGKNPWNNLETMFSSDGTSYTDLYNDWTAATDKKLEAKENYDRWFRAANYENWLLAAYGCIIIGPAEDFNGDDIYDEDIIPGYGALDTLEKYIDGDGTIMLFHDTLTKYADKGSINLTTRLRAAFGQDKNHMTEIDYGIVGTCADASKLYYLPYKVDEGYDSTTYFMTNLSYKAKTDNTRYESWLSDIVSAANLGQYQSMAIRNSNNYLTTVAYSDGLLLSSATYGTAPAMYKYAEYQWGTAAIWNNSAASTVSGGANRATQVNKGLVTLYPYTLSDRLNISPTHVQAYALDLEPSNMTVWYTLAGGTYGNNNASSLHAASPNDGTDSYFIYSFGNVFYCGAGHAEITGALKDNNDERRLYLNVICNAATNVPVTSISAYDYGKETNEVVKKNGKEYIYKLDENDSIPEFSFKFTLGKGLSLRQVNIYYDIDESGTYTDGDEYIKQYASSDVKDKTLTNVPSSLENMDDFKLTIDPTYLTNGKYVYIVIEVVDTDGHRTRKKIRVEYKDTLYNLT